MFVEPPEHCSQCGNTFYPASPISHWNDGVTDEMYGLCLACIFLSPESEKLIVTEIEIKGIRP